jgi:hypothetical protein
MLFGFVISKCRRLQRPKNHFTPSVFYYMKPEKRTFIVLLKKTCSYREIGVHPKNVEKRMCKFGPWKKNNGTFLSSRLVLTLY